MNNIFNQAQNFLNPIAQRLSQGANSLQRFIQSPQQAKVIPDIVAPAENRPTIPLPAPFLQAAKPFQQPITAVQHAGEALANLPGQIFSNPVNAAINTGLDIGRIGASALGAPAQPTVPTQPELKSPLAKLAYSVATKMAPEAVPADKLKIDTPPQSFLGNYAGAAAPLAPFSSGLGLVAPSGETGSIISQTPTSFLQAAGKGAIAAAPKGFETGFLQGLSTHMNEKDLSQQIIKAVGDGTISAAQFAALGGITAGGKYIIDSNKAKQAIQFLNSPEGQRGSVDFNAKLGDIQQQNQNPDLTTYENALNNGDMQATAELGAKYPDDMRFQVHKYMDVTPNLDDLTQKARNNALVAKLDAFKQLNGGEVPTDTTQPTRFLKGAQKPEPSIPGGMENPANEVAKPTSLLADIGRHTDTDTTFIQRYGKNIDLKPISKGGSSRNVYDLGDKVVKIAKTAKGLEQNGLEGDMYAPVPEVIEKGKDYVIVEKIGPPDTLTKQFVKDLRDAQLSTSHYTDALNKVSEKYRTAGNEDLANIADDLMNYDPLMNDLTAIRNWGTSKDGLPVLVDAGALNKGINFSSKVDDLVLNDYQAIQAARKTVPIPEGETPIRFLKGAPKSEPPLPGSLENPAAEATQPSFLASRMDAINRTTTGAKPPETTQPSFLSQRMDAINKATQPTTNALSEFENSIKSSPKESIAYFNDQGEKIYQTTAGGKYSAKIPVEDAGKIADAVMTSHNHRLVDPANPSSELNAIATQPDSYDIQQAIEKGVKEVRTVSPLGTVSDKIPDNLDKASVGDAFKQASINGELAYKEALAGGQNKYMANAMRVKAENDALIKGLDIQVTKTPDASFLQSAPTAPTENVGFLQGLKNKVSSLFGGGGQEAPPQQPTTPDLGATKERGFITTVKESPNATQDLKDAVTGTYNVRHNSDLLQAANARIASNPESAMQFAMNDKSDESVATANLLVKQLSEKGNTQVAADIVNQKAAQLTEAGRTIQAASLFDSLSPEGIGQLAAKTIQKYNIAAKQKIPELNGDQLQAFQDMAAKVQSLPEGTAKNAARADLMQSISDLTPKSWTERLVNNFAEALNLPRSIMATGDLSAPLRQGAFLVGRPKQWVPAFKDMFKYAFSKDSFTQGMDDIKASPNYEMMQNSGLSLTDPSAPDLTGREEAFMSNFSEKIPVFGKIAAGSNRAYTGFLNQLRANTFNDLYQKAQDQGVLDERPQVATDIAHFVNTATGRGDFPGTGGVARASVLLSNAFFSPRLMASRLSLLNPVYYVQQDPFVRKEALNSLMGFAATGIAITSLAKMGGAQVSDDPRSSDFGKIKVGNTRYDPWGGFQQYIVAATRLISGQMVSSTTGKEIHLGEGYKPTTRLDIAERALESKQSPLASFVTGLLRGVTATGEPFEVPREVASRFIPLLYQDIYELQKEWGAKGYLMAVPGVFGVGSQTYGDQIPMKGKTATGKPNIQWRQEPGLPEVLINKVTGKEVSNIPQNEWKPLQEKRNADTLQKIALSKAQAEVLATGKAQQVGSKYVSLVNGIVTTKDVGPKPKKTPLFTGKGSATAKLFGGTKAKKSTLFGSQKTKKGSTLFSGM
jgi:hypothetical protein